MHDVRNVFEAILKYGHDEDFAPPKDCAPTNAPAGSEDKVGGAGAVPVKAGQ